MRRRLAELVLVSALATAGASSVARPVAGQDASRMDEKARAARAVHLHDEARDLYARGEYRAALGKLEAALELDPDGKELVYNVALIHERLGEVDQAEAFYRRYLEMETDAKNKERVVSILRRLEGAKKEVTPQQTIVVVAPPPVAPPPAKPTPIAVARPTTRVPGAWIAVSGGISAAAFTLSGIMALGAALGSPGSNATTGVGVTYDDLEARAKGAHRQAVIADVSLVVGGIAGATALYLFLATRPGAKASRAFAPSGRLAFTF